LFFRNVRVADDPPTAPPGAGGAGPPAAQGRFWEMHDALFAHQDALTPPALRRYAQELGVDVERFWDDVRTREHAPRVGEDVRSADESGVAGTPTFFINGRRHQGAYDVETLTAAVRRAHSRARLAAAA
jgi:protein-disulfide isomerase